VSGRHAAGKHRRSNAPAGGRQEQATPKLRPAPGGAPFAVAGVAAVAVAAVGGLSVPEASSLAHGSDKTDTGTLAAVPLDQQVTELRADASQLAQRASRAQQRVALAQKKKAAEAARKRAEALRPKYVLPVSGYHLTAGFGESSSLWSHTHTGQDFAAPTGTPIHAITDGTIVSASWGGAYGWRIILRHKDGTESWYCHMSAFVRRSGTVKAGTVIGRVGATGNVTGAHLHLEIRPGGGDPINPMPWLRARGLHP
jgi:murein DD-endopeptidase MepM/ murein hydrolase activator NlpD